MRKQLLLCVLSVTVLGGLVIGGCEDTSTPPPPEEIQKPSGLKPDPSQDPPGGNIREGGGQPANETPTSAMPMPGGKKR
ncbi:MAG: hypothetical protein OHK0029_35190 [Armatimonadaceae bacterium]